MAGWAYQDRLVGHLLVPGLGRHLDRDLLVVRRRARAPARHLRRAGTLTAGLPRTNRPGACISGGLSDPSEFAKRARPCLAFRSSARGCRPCARSYPQCSSRDLHSNVVAYLAVTGASFVRSGLPPLRSFVLTAPQPRLVLNITALRLRGRARPIACGSLVIGNGNRVLLRERGRPRSKFACSTSADIGHSYGRLPRRNIDAIRIRML